MMRFDRLTERAQDTAMRSYEIMQRYQHSQVDTEHFFLALIEQPDGLTTQILEKLNASVPEIRSRLEEVLERSPKSTGVGYSGQVAQVFITPRLKRIIDVANDEAGKLKDEYISTEHLLLGIASERNTPSSNILREQSVTKERILKIVEEGREGQRVTEPSTERPYRTLEKYSLDLTSMASKGFLDPVVGREDELSRIAQILSQRKRNNPLIVGAPGVGKTAIVEGLAQRIITGDAPQILQNKKIFSLDLHPMVAGTRFRGELEERVTAIVEDIRTKQGGAILFIDNLQEHVGMPSIGIVEVLQSAISRGYVQVIAATTVESYESYCKPSLFFARSFQPLFVSELSVEQTIVTLETLRSKYEEHHKIAISDEAIEAAVRISDRYIKDRYQPEKSIQIIDEDAASLHLSQLMLPPNLQAKRLRLGALAAEEEAAWAARDYVRAAEHKVERIKLEQDFDEEVAKWQAESGIPDVVTRKEILATVSRTLGVPIEKLNSEETTFSDLARSGPELVTDVSTEELRLGDRFRQKYEVLSMIGRGAFGEVWLVRNRELDRLEAIKVLPASLLQSRKLAERFRSEARMAAKLNHPNIVTIYDTGEGAGHRYIAMEYITGPDLARIIDQQGRLSVEAVQKIAIQICDALDYAHRQGVIHRDIKPSNVLLDGGMVKIADFGISVIIKDSMTELTGMGGGTPSYRAPEQIRGWDPDPRTDIYSLGVTLYELLTGERPFRGMSVEHQHLNETPLPPSHLHWEIPSSVDRIVLRCLET